MLEARAGFLAAHGGGRPAALLEDPLKVGSWRPSLIGGASHPHVPPASAAYLDEVYIVSLPQADLRAAHGIVVGKDQES